MKLIASFALLAIACSFASALDAGPYSSTVAASIAPAKVLQTSPTPPPIFTFAPGSSYSIDFLGVPQPHAKTQWATCIGTPFAALPLNTHWSIVTDLLGGFNFTVNQLTAGYGVGLQYMAQGHLGATTVTFFTKFGGAQLYGSGIKPVPGFEFAAGISFTTR